MSAVLAGAPSWKMVAAGVLVAADVVVLSSVWVLVVAS